MNAFMRTLRLVASMTDTLQFFFTVPASLTAAQFRGASLQPL
jgi:hypothetical protein